MIEKTYLLVTTKGRIVPFYHTKEGAYKLVEWAKSIKPINSVAYLINVKKLNIDWRVSGWTSGNCTGG